MEKFKYIANISIDELDNSLVIPCIDEDGFHSILIKNSIRKSTSSQFSTDNLTVKLDTTLHLNDNEYFFHILTSTKSDMYSVGQFQIIYEYIFKKIEDPVTSSELTALITSLEDYFRTTPDPNLFSLQVGVFGELFAIKYLFEAGYRNVINKYHQNFYSKHDIELDKKNRVEIKTTVSEKRIHHFRHNQIYRNDINVYVCSVMLEQSKEGCSLYEMFMEIIKLYDADPDSTFALHKLMKKCACGEENHGLIFAINKAYIDFRVYNAVDLPKIELDAPNGVTNIEYDVDCSTADNLDTNRFIDICNSIE